MIELPLFIERWLAVVSLQMDQSLTLGSPPVGSAAAPPCWRQLQSFNCCPVHTAQYIFYYFVFGVPTSLCAR